MEILVFSFRFNQKFRCKTIFFYLKGKVQNITALSWPPLSLPHHCAVESAGAAV